MKYYLLFTTFFTLLYHLPGIGQGNFLDSTYVWTEAEYLGNSGYVHSLKFSLNSVPVVIGSKSYYEIIIVDSINSTNWEGTGDLIRFDNNRVWKYGLPAEYILLDFNLKVNDVFTDFFGSQMKVIQVDTTILENGAHKKRLMLDCGVGTIYWIEGIGSSFGLDVYYSQCSIDATSRLLCVMRNDTLLYLNPDYHSCWLNSVSTTENRKNNITFFPNPVHEILNILDPDVQVLKIIVRNSLGQIVNSGTSKEIDMNDFPAGCYTLSLLLETGIFKVEKIIKN